MILTQETKVCLALLVASHIKPWRDADNIERLDQYNGFLLLPNLDKVFDLGFITFRATGEIIVSKQIESINHWESYRI